MHVVSLSEARINLMELVDRVIADKTRIAITRKKGEAAVLISESEWLSIRDLLQTVG